MQEYKDPSARGEGGGPIGPPEKIPYNGYVFPS